jgi:hypothetical protein
MHAHSPHFVMVSVIGVRVPLCAPALPQGPVPDEEEGVVGVLEGHVGCRLDVVFQAEQHLQQLEGGRGLVGDADASLVELRYGLLGVQQDVARPLGAGEAKTRHRLNPIFQPEAVHQRHWSRVNRSRRHGGGQLAGPHRRHFDAPTCHVEIQRLTCEIRDATHFHGHRGVPRLLPIPPTVTEPPGLRSPAALWSQHRRDTEASGHGPGRSTSVGSDAAAPCRSCLPLPGWTYRFLVYTWMRVR